MDGLLPRIQIALTGLLLIGVGTLSVQVARLSARVALLEDAPVAAAVATERAHDRAPRVVQRPGTANAAAAPEAAPEVAGAVDDHLWSEDGRAAISDVIEEREQTERDKMRDRWQRMAELHTNRVLDKMTTELDLDEATATALRDLVDAYGDARSDRWRRMRDEDVDLAALQEESDAARDRYEADVTALIGAAGFEALEQAFSEGHRW